MKFDFFSPKRRAAREGRERLFMDGNLDGPLPYQVGGVIILISRFLRRMRSASNTGVRPKTSKIPPNHTYPHGDPPVTGRDFVVATATGVGADGTVTDIVAGIVVDVVLVDVVVDGTTSIVVDVMLDVDVVVDGTTSIVVDVVDDDVVVDDTTGIVVDVVDDDVDVDVELGDTGSP